MADIKGYFIYEKKLGDIVMCGCKASDMADINGYFIYEKKSGDIVESFPTPDTPIKNAEYQVWVNTRWANPNANDCNHYSIGYYDNLDDAKTVLQVLTSIPNPYIAGNVFVFKDKIVMKTTGGEFLLWQKNGGEKQNE